MIIGLSGKARCGKDTIAEYIAAGYIGVKKYALADPLKKSASIMFNIPLNHFYDADKKEVVNEFWGISPREIAQKVGTECAREVFRQDFWLKRCESQMNDSPVKPVIFIVSDVRFENEAAWIRENGGEVWHIERPTLGEGVVRAHASEAGIEPKVGDRHFLNDGTLAGLYLQVDSVLMRGTQEYS